jgi:REP element-mobilizing transposase RayT
MKKYTYPLEPNIFYQIVNRGINGEQLFKQLRNYSYFLSKYVHYIQPIADTYAYVLMGNHFHFLIRTKTEAQVRIAINRPDWSIQAIYSHQFSKFFNCYAQSINKQEHRTGALLEESFRRIPIYTESYLLHMVYYIHFNPEKHKFVRNFELYPNSSYPIFIGNGSSPVPLQIEEVLTWFGGIQGFLKYHESKPDSKDKWLEDYWGYDED